MIVEEIERIAVVAVVAAGFVSTDVDRAPALVVTHDRAEVVNVSHATTVQTAVERPQIHITGGNQGPQGIQGVPGPAGGQSLQAIAGVALGGHRAVTIEGNRAVYAEPSAPSADRVAGITLAAAAAEDLIPYQTSGEVTEPSWNWLEGPIFLGPAGVLTQTPPAMGVCIELGIATTPTTIIVRIGPPIRLQ